MGRIGVRFDHLKLRGGLKTQILEEIYSLGVCSRRVVAMLIAQTAAASLLQFCCLLSFAATVTLEASQ